MSTTYTSKIEQQIELPPLKYISIGKSIIKLAQNSFILADNFEKLVDEIHAARISGIPAKNLQQRKKELSILYPESKIEIAPIKNIRDLENKEILFKQKAVALQADSLKSNLTKLIKKSADNLQFNNIKIQSGAESIRITARNPKNEFIITQLSFTPSQLSFTSETLNVKDNKCEVLLDSFINEVENEFNKKGLSIKVPGRKSRKPSNASILISKKDKSNSTSKASNIKKRFSVLNNTIQNRG